MNSLLTLLIDHGLMLLTGSTIVLVGGGLAMCIPRSPVQRQRLGELSIVCTLIWIGLACVRIPRWGGSTSRPAPPTTSAVVERRLTSRVFDVPLMVIVDPPPQATGVQLMPTDATPTSRLPAIAQIPAAPSPVTSVSVGKLLSMLYFAGGVVCLAWLAMGHAMLWRFLRNSSQPEPWLVELMERVGGEMSFGARVRLLITDQPTRPFSCGIFRPTIVLSRDTVLTQNAGRLRQVLRHEFVHLMRRDAWGNALINLALAPLYFHPAYWFIRRRAFLARELVADARAAAVTDRLAYAADLLALAKASRARPMRALAAVGMFAFTTDLTRRITMLLRSGESLEIRVSNRSRLSWTAVFAAGLVVMCGTIGLRPASGDDDPCAKNSTEGGAGQVDSARQHVDQAARDAARAEAEARHDPLFFGAKRAEPADPLRGGGRDVPSSQQGPRTSGRQTNTAVDFLIKSFEIELEAAELQLEKDQIDLARKESLLVSHGVAIGEVEEARVTVKIDALKVRSAKNNLERAKSEREAGKPAVEANVAAAPLSRGGELDVVSLANSYANALGEVRLARTKVQAARSSADERTTALAQAELENAIIKSQMLTRIVEVAKSHAREEADRARQKMEQGVITYGEASDARARLNILEAIHADAAPGEKPGLNDADPRPIR